MKTVELRVDIWGVPHSFLYITDTATGSGFGRGFAPIDTGLTGVGQIHDDTAPYFY